MMTYAKIIECIKCIMKFAEKDYKLPSKLRLAIRKNRKVLVEEYKIFEEERLQLIEEYDAKTDEEKAKINKELMELLDTKTKVEIEKLSIDVLDDIDMTLGDEDLLMFMLEE